MKLIITIGMIGKWLKTGYERSILLSGRTDDNGKKIIELQAMEDNPQPNGDLIYARVFEASGTIVSVCKQFAEWIKKNG